MNADSVDFYICIDEWSLNKKIVVIPIRNANCAHIQSPRHVGHAVKSRNVRSRTYTQN